MLASPRIPTSNEELVFQTLQQRCFKQSQNLFDEQGACPEYWRLSDLAILYPNTFDIKQPITQYEITKMNDLIKSSIPTFRDLQETPIHVLDVKETYNILLPDQNTIKTIKNGHNQYFTRIACEYMFRKKLGHYLQQAYFMYPTKNADELKIASESIKFEQIRSTIANNSNLLSAIINRAYGANKASFAKVWHELWCAFYNTNHESVSDRYNLKSSPINYMRSDTFNYIISMLQNIETQFANKQYYSINEVLQAVHNMGLFARSAFIRHGLRPENELTDENSYKRVSKVRKDRKKFWEQYYPLSLKQR